MILSVHASYILGVQKFAMSGYFPKYPDMKHQLVCYLFNINAPGTKGI